MLRCRRCGGLAAPAKSKTDIEDGKSQHRYGTGDGRTRGRAGLRPAGDNLIA